MPVDYGPGTRAVHAGDTDDPLGTVSPPLVTSVNYRQDEPGVPRSEYVYGRTNNPTRQLLEVALAKIEGSGHAVTFSSGMAALDGVVRSTCSPQDHVVLPDDVFSGTSRLFRELLAGWGLSTTHADMTDLAAVERAINLRTKLVLAESPSNPLLRVADVRALGQLAHRRGARLVMDNTFGTPFTQKLLELGAHVTVSSNKFFSGHADCMVGIVTTNDADLAHRLRSVQNSAGAVPSPWDCWMTLRGIKTLPLRLERQSQTALRVATWLQVQRSVRRVYFPGLTADPGHRVAARQMSNFGAVVSFSVTGGADAAKAVCRSTRLFTLAESVGSVESLIQLPHLMTHHVDGLPQGIDPSLVRLSIGLEDAEDLIRDLSLALGALPDSDEGFAQADH
jgi:cystathionine gamma-synthase